MRGYYFWTWNYVMMLKASPTDVKDICVDNSHYSKLKCYFWEIWNQLTRRVVKVLFNIIFLIHFAVVTYCTRWWQERDNSIRHWSTLLKLGRQTIYDSCSQISPRGQRNTVEWHEGDHRFYCCESISLLIFPFIF